MRFPGIKATRTSRPFERVIERNGLGRLAELTRTCNDNRQHDQRAALVCLLTAAGVFAGTYTAVGDEHGGYFFLPPWQSWAAWAREELDLQRVRVAALAVWIRGNRFGTADALPAT